MLATDVADARGRSLAIAAVMSFSKFSGGYGPKGLSAIYETMFNHHALIFGFPIGGTSEGAFRSAMLDRPARTAASQVKKLRLF
jgi:hypothetical protein